MTSSELKSAYNYIFQATSRDSDTKKRHIAIIIALAVVSIDFVFILSLEIFKKDELPKLLLTLRHHQAEMLSVVAACYAVIAMIVDRQKNKYGLKPALALTGAAGCLAALNNVIAENWAAFFVILIPIVSIGIASVGSWKFPRSWADCVNWAFIGIGALGILIMSLATSTVQPLLVDLLGRTTYVAIVYISIYTLAIIVILLQIGVLANGIVSVVQKRRG